MPDTQHIAVKPLSCVTPERARDARARAWAYVFDCHAKKNADKPAPEPVGYDGTKVKEDSADVPIIIPESP